MRHGPGLQGVGRGQLRPGAGLSLANVQSCEPDPVAEITHGDVAAANYNVGMLYRIVGDFGSALENLERARNADPANSVIAEAIDEALSAEAASAEIGRVEQDAIDRARALEAEAAERAERVLTNAYIVGMVNDGLPDEVNHPAHRVIRSRFDVSPATLGKLNRRGLSSAVISAMIAAAGGERPAAGEVRMMEPPC